MIYITCHFKHSGKTKVYRFDNPLAAIMFAQSASAVGIPYEITEVDQNLPDVGPAMQLTSNQHME
jgi:hypothetical protein